MRNAIIFALIAIAVMLYLDAPAPPTTTPQSVDIAGGRDARHVVDPAIQQSLSQSQAKTAALETSLREAQASGNDARNAALAAQAEAAQTKRQLEAERQQRLLAHKLQMRLDEQAKSFAALAEEKTRLLATVASGNKAFADLQEQFRGAKMHADELEKSVKILEEKLRAMSDELVRRNEAVVAQQRRADALAADARRSSEAAADKVAKLEAERKQAADKLATAERAAAAQAAEMTKRLASEQARATQLGRDLASARERLAQAAREKAPEGAAKISAKSDEARQPAPRSAAPTARTKTTSAMSASIAPVAAPTGLPDDVSARVVLRYAHDSESARARAAALRSTLQALGFEVTESARTPRDKVGNHVTYFYKEDQSIASGVASELATPAPIQSSILVDPLPRPGTIEVLIGG